MALLVNTPQVVDLISDNEDEVKEKTDSCAKNRFLKQLTLSRQQQAKKYRHHFQIEASKPKAMKWKPFYLLQSNNIFTTSATANRHNAEECVKFSDLFRGNFRKAVLGNFMICLETMHEHCPRLFQSDVDTYFIHGVATEDKIMNHEILPLFNQGNTHIALAEPRVLRDNGSKFSMYDYGKHHCKYGLLFYDNGIRVFITTANYISSDIDNLTNAVYVQDFPLYNKGCDVSTKVFTDFENELSSYFTHLLKYMKLEEEWRRRVSWIVESLKEYDFSSAECDLVITVPGTYRGKDMAKFGQARVNHLLIRNEMGRSIGNECSLMKKSFASASSSSAAASSSSSSSSSDRIHGITIQHSSFSSLGNDGKFLHDICGVAGFCPFNVCPEIQLIWPTYKAILESVNGIDSGGSIPADRKNLYGKSKVVYLLSSIFEYPFN